MLQIMMAMAGLAFAAAPPAGDDCARPNACRVVPDIPMTTERGGSVRFRKPVPWMKGQHLVLFTGESAIVQLRHAAREPGALELAFVQGGGDSSSRPLAADQVRLSYTLNGDRGVLTVESRFREPLTAGAAVFTTDSRTDEVAICTLNPGSNVQSWNRPIAMVMIGGFRVARGTPVPCA